MNIVERKLNLMTNKKMIKSNPDTLVILGNGFDIHCGLDTKYSDFMKFMANFYKDCGIDSKYLRENINGYLMDCDNIINNIKKNPSDYDHYNFLDKNYSTQLFRNNYMNNNDKSSCNFWFIYFCLLKDLNQSESQVHVSKDRRLKDWYDFEKQISLFFHNYSSTLETYIKSVKRFNIFNKDNEIDNTENAIIFHMSEYLYNKATKLNYTKVFMPVIIMHLLKRCGFNSNKDNLYDFLFSQLYSLEDSFKKFIYIKNVKKWNHYNIARKKLMSKLTNNKPYNLINFNYTFGNTRECNERDNVHSTISKKNGHPIFGIDIHNSFNKPYYKFTKTYRIMALAKGKDKNLLSLSPGPKKIVFYGQSLARADYSYFMAIFNHFHIYDSKSHVSLIFCYSEFDNKEEKRQFSRIYKLLNNYGQQSNHPDILHKMLLENRIMIKRIN